MPRDGMLDCLNAKVDAGKLNRQQAEYATNVVRDLEVEHARFRSRSEAEIEAELAAGEKLRTDAAARRRREAFHLLRFKEVRARAETHPGGLGNGVLAHFDASSAVGWINVSSLQPTILGHMHAKFADGIEQLRPKWLGIRNSRKKAANVVRELFGETTGDGNAALIARQWRDAAEFARELINRGGGDIRFRKDFALPMHWTADAVRRAGRERWKRAIRPRLNRARVLNQHTGKPLTDPELNAALDAAWDDISTNGLASMVPGRGSSDPSVARLEHARLFQFATADDWLALSNEFGDRDTFRILAAHLERMSHEIALVKIFGPKHGLVVKQLTDTVRADEARRGMKGALKAPTIDTEYRFLSGQLDRDDEGVFGPRLAKIGQDTRSLLVASYLGSAPLAALGDMTTNFTTAGINGIPRVRLMQTLFSQLGPKGPELRRWAVRRAIAAENWTGRALFAKRYQDDVAARGVLSWAADAAMRTSGLSGMTQGGRNAFALEFYATLAEHGDLALDQMPDALRNQMMRYGITVDDWDLIRSAPRFEPEPGADFIDPPSILDMPGVDRQRAIDVAFKLGNMVNQEKDHAVIVPRSRVRAGLTFGTTRGTFMGEIARSVGMFKSFPLTLMMLHGQRAMQIGRSETPLKGVWYTAKLAVGLTLLGGLTVQLRDIGKGRDPRDMTDPRFWGAALMQGGALGIFGDFIYAAENRYGHGPISTAAGPVANFGEDVFELTVGNLAQLAQGQDTNFPREAVRFTKRHVPGASHWYLRTILDRMIWDTIQEEVDPEYRKSFRRSEQNFADDYGQRHWWRRGEPTPERAPDLGAALGGGE